MIIIIWAALARYVILLSFFLGVSGLSTGSIFIYLCKQKFWTFHPLALQFDLTS